MPYKPNYRMYSKPQDGWHDEPFEYVFSFFNSGATAATQAADTFNFLNNPLQLDPDADFYLRGIAIVVDVEPVPVESSNVNVLFDMRLRDSWGRYLDNSFIPIGAYATCPLQNFAGQAEFFSWPGNPPATPWYPELYCPSNSAMWADFQAENGVGGVGTPWYYSFHLYFQGVKRFQNEDCKPGSTSTSSAKVAA